MKLQSMIRTFAVIGSLLHPQVLSFVLNNNAPAQQRQAYSPSSSCLRISTTISSPTSISNLDDYLLGFAEMLDDSKRREDFETFVRSQVIEGGGRRAFVPVKSSSPKSEQSPSSSAAVAAAPAAAASTKTTVGGGFKSRDTIYVVDRVTDGLIRLGESIQDRSWDKYVASGFQEDAALIEDKQLWACIDMLVQLKVLAKEMKQHNPKNKKPPFRSGGFPTTSTTSTEMKKTKKKNGKCGMCTVCTCSRERNPATRK